MATIHLLTKNNEKTIVQTLESIKPCLPKQVLVADRGSTDKTKDICEDFGAKVLPANNLSRSEARSKLLNESSERWNMMIEPWETMIQGHQTINRMNGPFYNASIIEAGTIRKEVRFWQTGKWINPVYERIDVNTTNQIDSVFYSTSRNDQQEVLDEVRKWKLDEPMESAPYYYEAATLLSMGKYNDFYGASEHYMAMEKNRTSISAIMNRYYYAMAKVIHGKKARPALQNLNLCLCAKPLMAEFWCLTGDVYYHLLNKFEHAIEFYENAMILGSHRLKEDVWPMEISKYKDYPSMMIDKCQEIISDQSTFGILPCTR